MVSSGLVTEGVAKDAAFLRGRGCNMLANEVGKPGWSIGVKVGDQIGNITVPTSKKM